MLAPMPRLSERNVGWLGALTVLALLAHAFLLAPGLEPPDPWLDHAEARVFVGVTLLFALTGRVVLSFFPPGEVGSHAWRDLPVTAATSLLVGSQVAWLLPGYDVPPLYWIIPLLALARWFTLPGAMVPRHAPPRTPLGALDLLAVVAGLAWVVYSVLIDVLAPGWLALLVLVFHALGVARRRRAGRYAVLALGALLLVPSGALHAGPTSGLTPASSMGIGASFLVPWLRRSDKRAGLLAALGFGSLFAIGPTLLGMVGPGVMVFASHPRQRRFAATTLLACALPFFLLAFLLRMPERFAVVRPDAPRGRLLWLPEILSDALAPSDWGLAWPLLVAALVLGALTFPWRGEDWTPGTIEEPRREVRALTALIALAGAAVALPSAPWAEVDLPVIFFPPCALLAGLLLIPPERVAATA
jgi:hypothetical protein